MERLPTRLKEARLKRGMTLEGVADELGTSFTSVWRYEAGQRRPSGSTLYGLATLYGKPVEWFFGEVESEEIASSNGGDANQDAEQSALQRIQSEIGARIDSLEAAIRSTVGNTREPALEVRHVEIYEVAASAGAGMHIEEAPVKGTLAFRREWLDSNSIDPVQCSIIGVAGESMEPTLVEGCSILVDRSNYRRRRREGRIFVINAEEGLIVKRAAKDTAGDWFIESDHPAWDPEPWPENAEVVGEVRWMARTF